MIIGIYSRVSKDKKGADRSLPLQQHDGEAFAKEKGWEFIHYAELEGTTGTSKERPEFQKMVSDIKEKRIQATYAYDMSRYERNEWDKLILLEAVQKAGAKIYTSRDGFVDFTKPENKLMLDQLSSFNAYFVAKTKANVVATLNRNLEEGRVHSAPQYGFTRGEHKKLVIHPETSKVVELMYDLCIAGNGAKHIATWLDDNGHPTPSNLVGGESLTYRTKTLKNKVSVKKSKLRWNPITVNRILRNSLYKGERLWNNKVYHIDAIIAPEKWERAQAAIAKNKHHSVNNTSHDYLLKGGIIQCGYCHNNYIGYTQTKRNVSVYMCGAKKHHNNEHKCTNKRVDKDTMDEIVWQRVIGNPMLLKVLRKDFEFDKDVAVDHQVELDRLNGELDDLKKGKAELIGMVAKGLISEDDLAEQLPELNADINELGKKIKNIEDRQGAINDKNEILSEVARFQEKFKTIENAPFALRRKLVGIFIDRVIVSHDINYNMTDIIIHLKLSLDHHSLTDSFSLNLKAMEVTYEHSESSNRSIDRLLKNVILPREGPPALGSEDAAGDVGSSGEHQPTSTLHEKTENDANSGVEHQRPFALHGYTPTYYVTKTVNFMLQSKKITTKNERSYTLLEKE